MAVRALGKLQRIFPPETGWIASVFFRYYGVALLTVAAALGITLLANSLLQGTPAALFYVAVMLSSWSGGLRAGLLATVLSTIALNYFFFDPYYSFSVVELKSVVQSGVFAMTALLISYLNGSRLAAKRRADANLKSWRESEARFLHLAEANILGIFSASLAGSITQANDAFLRMVGYTREDLLAGIIRWDTMTPPEYEQVSAKSQVELRTLGFCKPFEKEYIRKDGSRVPILLGSVMQDPHNVIGFVLDRSEAKRNEAQRARIEAERDVLLRQERIAREEAERANRIKDEFLAVLSHELRSPLNPILGWTKLLQARQFSPEKTAEALATIERNAKLQAQLIEDLLDVSRILQGKMVLKLSAVNLATIINAAIETVCLAAEAKSIEIHTLLDEEITIAGDAARLQQIVWNLLTNAVKFTSPSGCIEVRLDRIEGFAQIQVQDTGKGINPDFLPHVFDYFRQEDGATTRKFGGLGLGLALVKHLTEQHGGTVAVESAGENQGATFTIRLPLKSLPLNPAEVPLPTPTFNLQGLKVAIVDDEADMRELLWMILEVQGAEVKAADSAIAALTLLEHWQPDVLISDIGMPEMDGYSLMRQVRCWESQQSNPRQIPAIALTAYAGELDQQQAIEAGFQQHLAKPIEPDQLVEAIVHLLKSAQSQGLIKNA